jgi:hypothetical protein
MSESQVVIKGTLKPDGSLELAERPSLPAGSVEVTIRSIQEVQTAGEDFLQYLRRARIELEAAGAKFRTKEEIDTDLEELRSGDERLEDVYNDINATHKGRQPHEC